MAGPHRVSRLFPRRRNAWEYDPNDIDLLRVKQKNPVSPTGYDLLTSYTYRPNDPPHLPGTTTDTAAQTTTYTYNTEGQLLTVTTPPRAGITENRTTTYSYDTNGYLQSVTGPETGATASYTFDGYGRARTLTNSDGYTLTVDYDVMDRPTTVTYPDGTYREIVYNRLDAERHRDRLGRWSSFIHDVLRRVVLIRDPLGRTVTQQWCTCGNLDKVVDANGNQTTWGRDVQGRVTRETRATGSEILYTYENTTSRLKRSTDLKGQHADYQYFRDNNLQSISYPNPQSPTPNVSFTYDPSFERVSTMVDGTGSTAYAYHPIGATPPLGAGRLASVDGPLENDTISYAYDELGRVVSRSINGVVATQAYDALGRITGETNALGSFTYGYDLTTDRLLSVAYPNGQTTNYTYYPNSGDHRLQEIHHQRSGGATISKFNYTYDTVGNVKVWTQQTDSNAAKAYDLGYDAADQLTAATWRTTDPSPVILKRYVYSYDAAANRTAEQIDDSVTGAGYDNMNRLVSQQPGGPLVFKGTLNEAATVTVQDKPAQVSVDNKFEKSAQVTSGTNTVEVKAKDYSGNERTNTYQVNVSGSSKPFTYDANGNLTGDGTRTFEWDAEDRLVAFSEGTRRSEFVYNGRGRRVRIIEEDGAAVTSDRRFLWCGRRVCEERDSSGTLVNRRYFSLGTQEGADNFFYTKDHLASVREMSDAAGVVRARYEYDAYGKRTRIAGDKDAAFGFTGQYFHEPSGLGLTAYRAYDSSLGRWLNEDPLGLHDSPNRYAYVGNNPLVWTDPSGLTKMTLPPNPSGLGSEWTQDTGHKNPFGQRFTHPKGDSLEFHEGQPNKPGWRGKDHWHHNDGKEHLRPGDEVEVPDPEPVKEPTPEEPPPQSEYEQSPFPKWIPPVIIPVLILIYCLRFPAACVPATEAPAGICILPMPPTKA